MTDRSGVGTAPEPIWRPDPAAAERSTLTRFTRWVERTRGLTLPDYQALWQWSVDELEAFWSAVWEFFELAPGAVPEPVLTDRGMPGARWFPGVTLNFVDHVFRDRAGGRDPDAVAVVEAREDGGTAQVTWAELETRVASLAGALRGLGVRSGDRVVGYLPNSSAAVVGFLATASLGAVWSCCGPDYAAPAAASRLAQLEPVVLISADGYHFGGKAHDRRAQARDLAGLLPTLTAVVHVRHLGLEPPDHALPVLEWADALATPASTPLAAEPVAFEHPLWVLYSSGTTGVPKGIVHGHGGVVLDYHKVMALHLDVGADDRVFWYTTTNWMMWNFVVCVLLVGGSIVAYDGSPAYPDPDRLWQLAARHGVTVLGVSPGYLQACERHGTEPARDHGLSRLRLVSATGSPVPAGCHTWVRDHVGARIPLMVTSGGTDVVTGLAIGAPTLPIRPGEMPCAALGVALDAFDEQGRPVRDELGELVITAPMPTMPIYLWNDPDGSRYRDTYFGVYPGVWRHGDWITISSWGGVVIHGRSDATLNRHGVRLGSADVYEVVEAVDGVEESLVVGVDLPEGGYWMPLFVVLADGRSLDDALRTTIREAIRRDASPRHVPDEIIAVAAIPHTRTGKKLEVPIKRILLGARAADVLSLGAVDDVAALDVFVDLGRDRAERRAASGPKGGR